jgi:hypothetical protein
VSAVPSDHLEPLRLAAALAHSSVDADVEVVSSRGRWLVSYRHPGAAIDPCALRQLVLAARRGCRSPLMPVASIAFVGALREIGGGVYERCGPNGPERRLATVLPGGAVRTLLEAVPDAADLTAHVSTDDELGVTVVTLGAAHPGRGPRLDLAAYQIASACLVEELLATSAAGRP